MKLSELLAELGDDHLKLQRLDESVVGAKRVKGGTEVSFMTGEPMEAIMPILPGQRVSRMGLVVWVDADHWDATVRRLKKEGKL